MFARRQASRTPSDSVDLFIGEIIHHDTPMDHSPNAKTEISFSFDRACRLTLALIEESTRAICSRRLSHVLGYDIICKQGPEGDSPLDNTSSRLCQVCQWCL